MVYYCFRFGANWYATESASALTTASICVSVITDSFRKCKYRNSIRNKSCRGFIYFFRTRPTECSYMFCKAGAQNSRYCTYFIIIFFFGILLYFRTIPSLALANWCHFVGLPIPYFQSIRTPQVGRVD